jgi:acetylornithine deacetylase/succinyl-diaminopimelate desuccinylase-like protein
MTRPYKAHALVTAATTLLTALVAGAAQQAARPPQEGTPATIPPAVVAAAEKIANDPQVMALLKDQSTEAAAKARWNNFLELVRIPSPSRSEHLKAAEIHRRLVNEWGFSPAEVMTRADGVIPGSDTNSVDGLPVYNACVVIKGSYGARADAQHYRGQFPKVLVEGHIDVVNPEELPKSGDPSIRIKLQPYAQPVVATPEELAAIPDELSFDANGRVIENDTYATASRIFANEKEAAADGGVRIYVPGYLDMMASTSNAFILAAAMKKHNITPVYDIWICGTAGEEGKGNLAGVKQLYGFDQKAGTGSNPLNIVANFGLEGGGVVNFIGSYRFEMKFKAPSPRPDGPSAPEAMAAAIAKIADVKTGSDLRAGAPRTTYTVGRASCEPPPAPGMAVPSCSLEVDMRSTRKETLEDIRNTIEPTFQAGVSAENARHRRKDGSGEAISLELMWFGLRPAYVAESVDNVAVHAGLQSGIQLGANTSPMVGTGSGSLNDNVPAHTGVPTYQFSLASNAAGAGGHAFWEWGTRGAPATEVARMHRVLTAALIVAGFHAADGTVVEPAVGPMGKRTREVVR